MKIIKMYIKSLMILLKNSNFSAEELEQKLAKEYDCFKCDSCEKFYCYDEYSFFDEECIYCFDSESDEEDEFSS